MPPPAKQQVVASSTGHNSVTLLTREQEAQRDSCLDNTANVIVEIDGREETIKLSELLQKRREYPTLKMKDTKYDGQCKIQDPAR